LKNILFITHNLKGGGIQKVTIDAAEYHIKIGNKVTILTLENGVDFSFNSKIKHFTLPVKNFLLKRPHLALYFILYTLILRNIFPQSESVWASWLYKKIFSSFILSQSTFDCIFINGARTMKKMSHITEPNTVFSLHLPHVLSSKHSRYYDYLFTKQFANKKIYTVSDFIKKPIALKIERLKLDSISLETIYNPCDKEKLSILSNENLDFKEKFILAIGRLSIQKRFDILIDAYHLSKPPYKLIILGEGNQRELLEDKIKKLNLSNNVLLPGFEKNPLKWMGACEFFVLSSDVEGFGLVITEALACGKPVITTDCGPVTEILKGELKQGIVPKGNSSALANKITEYTNNPIYPNEDILDSLSYSHIIEQQLALAQQ
jgi:glycosyltransferase involved in cell wall biosynthesis